MEDVLSVVELCNVDFGVTLRYRSNCHPSRDTFFAFLYNYDFVLCRWEKEQLVFLELICSEKLKTFIHLAFTFCDDWKEKHDGCEDRKAELYEDLVIDMIGEGDRDAENPSCKP